jgi:hypothetical protein
MQAAGQARRVGLVTTRNIDFLGILGELGTLGSVPGAPSGLDSLSQHLSLFGNTGFVLSGPMPGLSQNDAVAIRRQFL